MVSGMNVKMLGYTRLCLVEIMQQLGIAPVLAVLRVSRAQGVFTVARSRERFIR